MKVAIRADSSTTIGSGHLMRCLTLAEKLSRHGASVSFICREHSGNLNHKVTASGFELIALPLAEQRDQHAKTIPESLLWIGDSIDNDARDSKLALLSRAREWDWLIVDHYHLDRQWESQLRTITQKIMVIDDIANRPHDCDLLLDQNLYADADSRYKDLIANDCRCLFGPEYALIRPQFVQQRAFRNLENEQLQHILVFFGGSDSSDETSKTLEALRLSAITDVHIDIIIGASNPHSQRLQVYCDREPNLHLHKDIDNMAEFMVKADLAIGAGGTATWERCCVGLATIAWPIAENQQQLLKTLSRHGAIYLLDEKISNDVESLAKVIFSVAENSDLRSWIRQRGMELVDGNGLNRVVKQILSCNVSLRIATIDDSRSIYKWRNAPSIREVSTQSDVIEWEEHLDWMNRVLTDDNRLLFIAENNKHPIGVLRYDIENTTAEVSIYLAPDAQGRGYGCELLHLGEKWICEYLPKIESIKAIILNTNTKSSKLFKDAGFTKYSSVYIKGL